MKYKKPPLAKADGGGENHGSTPVYNSNALTWQTHRNTESSSCVLAGALHILPT